MAKRKATEDSHPLAEAEQAVEPLRAEYGFDLAQRSVSAYGQEFILQNSVCGIKIRHSPRDGEGLHVSVAQLIDGQFPAHPGVIDERTELMRFDLRDIASARLGSVPAAVREKVEDDMPIDAADVAVLLTNCCRDLFRGDFSMFSALSRVVKERAARLAQEYPEKY